MFILSPRFFPAADHRRIIIERKDRLHKTCLDVVDEYLLLRRKPWETGEILEAMKTEIVRLANLEDYNIRTAKEVNDPAFRLLSHIERNESNFFSNVVCNETTVNHAKILLEYINHLSENAIFHLLSITDNKGKTVLHDLSERCSAKSVMKLLGKLSAGE